MRRRYAGQHFGLALIEGHPGPVLGLAIALERLRNRPVKVCAWGKVRSRENSHGLCLFVGSFKIWRQKADCQSRQGGAELKKYAQRGSACTI